jgi:heat shock protein HtpX
MTLYTQQDKNIRRTWSLMFFFCVFVIGFGWLIGQAMGDSRILVFAVVFAIANSIISFLFSDKIVLAMSGAQPIDQNDPNQKEIYRLVENLAITAGLPVPKVYLIDDPAMNAFATGRNAKTAVVALTTGIVNKLEKNELEGVIAHELAHVGNKDMLLQTVVVVMVGFIALLSDYFLRYSFFFGGGRKKRSKDSGGLGAILVIAAIVLAILAPIAATLIQLAISRKREFLADASGGLLTRYPEGLASALEKISQDQTPMRHANKATAHLFISNPFNGKKISRLWMTHPPIEERVKALRGMEIQT